MPGRATFVVIALAFPSDGDAYDFLRSNRDELDVITGPRVGFVPPPARATSFQDLFREAGRERLQIEVRRADLPCLYVEDQDDHAVLIPLRGLGRDAIRDLIRRLGDAANDAGTAVELQARLAAGQPEPTPMPTPDPDPQAPAPKPGTDPISLVQLALQKNPAVMKIAITVAGMLALAAIVLPFFESSAGAVSAFLIMAVMMVIVVFVTIILRSTKSWWLFAPAVVIAWGISAALVLAIGVTMTSIVWCKPACYAVLVSRLDTSRPSLVTLDVDVRAAPTKQPVVEAVVTATGATYRDQAMSDAAGRAVFTGVPSNEHDLTVTAKATGFSDAAIHVDATGNGPWSLALQPLPAPPPPRPSPTPSPTPSPVPPPRHGPPSAALTAAQLEGVWQIQTVGDITNQVVRDGTFQFDAQNDGTFIVSATFEASGTDVTLRGRASLTGSVVSIEFRGQNAVGGTWNGRSRLEWRVASKDLRGSVQLKDGEKPAITLRKR